MKDRYTASVVGPSAIFPRGFGWILPIWCAAGAGALVLAHWPPMWFRLPAAAGLVCALITFLAVLGTLRSNAFLANAGGVWLGTRGGARRRWRRGQLTYLPWTSISRLRLRRAVLGAVIEVLPIPDPAPARRAVRAARLTGRWLGLLVFPPAYLFCRAAVTRPGGDPPRYRIRVRAVSVDDLGAALRAIAPPQVAVTVLTRRRLAIAGRREAVPLLAAAGAQEALPALAPPA